MAVRYEFSYTDNSQTRPDPETGQPVVVPVPMLFGLHGVTEDVAKGVRFGLKKVPTISDVHAERIVENRDNLPTGDPTP